MLISSWLAGFRVLVKVVCAIASALVSATFVLSINFSTCGRGSKVAL